MKSLIAVFLMVAAALPVRAQQSCAAVFGPNRETYAQRLRQLERAAGQGTPGVQMSADTQRRVLKALFVDTNIFFVHQDTGKWAATPPQPTLESARRRIEMIRSGFVVVYGKSISERPSADQSIVGKFALKNKMTPAAAKETLKVLEWALVRTDETAALVTAVLSKSTLLAARAEDQRIRSDANFVKSNTLSRERSSHAGPQITGGIVGGVGSGFALNALHTAFHIGGPDVGLVGIPLALVAGAMVHYGYAKYPMFTLAKAKYHAFRGRGLVKSLAKDMRRLADKPVEIKADDSNADFAFEKAWEDWRMNALQAEGARNKARPERIADRLQRLSLLLQTTGLWQLPNGERFADALKDGPVLTDERRATLAQGLQRKNEQLDLMMAELDWVERDVRQMTADATRPEFTPSDQTLNAAQAQLSESLTANARALRAVIEDRQDQLRFTDDRIDAGETDFHQFVSQMRDAREGN